MLLPWAAFCCVQFTNYLDWLFTLSCQTLSFSRAGIKSLHLKARTVPGPVCLWNTCLPVSVQFSHSVVSDSLQPRGLQHARFPCPSPIPRAYSNSCPLSQSCHPTISSSFSSCLQSFPAPGTFQMSQFFTLGGQSIGVSASASVLPMNIQD